MAEFARSCTIETVRKSFLLEPVPTTESSTRELLQSLMNAYLDEGASDVFTPFEAQLRTRDYLVFLLRAEVLALDNALREELERRKELERGLRNWRLAREMLEALDAGAREL